MKRNLVLSVVGDESVHQTWIAGREAPSFDLCLVYFGNQPGRFRSDADVYLERKGIKFALLHELCEGELADVVDQYEYIWIPDDDIAADSDCVNRLFSIARQFSLQLCQPAIGKGQAWCHALQANPNYLLRHLPYSEIMCPLFSRAAFQRCLPTFNANKSGWAIDWLWSSWFAEHEIGVIDAAAIHHTRPLRSGGVHGVLGKLGVDPMQEHDELVARHNLDIKRLRKGMMRGTLRLSAVTPDGRRVWTRSRLASWLKLRAA